MDIATLVNVVGPAVTGPGAAVLCLLAVLVGLWLFATKFLMPLTEKVANRHLTQIDRMLDQHAKDGEATRKALTEMTVEFRMIHARLGNIEVALDSVDEKIDGRIKEVTGNGGADAVAPT
jgi:hypothetical protein